jgi:hypothetical protein
MRGLRSLIILIVIAIPLGYLVYRDSQSTPGDDEPKKDKVFTVDAEKIDEITIKAEGGEQTRVQKSGGNWQIVAPVSAEPDTSEISSLTTNLATLEVQRVVDENAPDLEEYGLAQPRIEVTFKAGGDPQTLQIGQKTPPGSDLYAKRANENRVFLIPGHLESTFNKKPFDLRDKSAVKVDRDKLDALEVTAGDRTTRFTKPGGGEWRLAGPVDARADSSAIESLISRMTGLQMKSIAAESEGADAKKFGLEKPTAIVRLGTGSSQASIAFGGAAEEGSVYARDLSRPQVFTVDASVLEDVKKEPAEYRQKDLFDARSFNTTRLELVRSGQTHTFEKTKVKNKEGQDEEKWRQLAPQARDLDQASFDTLLSALTGTRAASYVTDAAATKALASPELTATVRFDDGKKEERVAFAKVGGDSYASRAGEPGAARLDATTLDTILKALQELK